MEHLPHRLQQITIVEVVQQLGHHFGVGLGGKSVALAHKVFLDLHVVLHNAVVDDRKASIGGHMGVRVCVRGHAMCGPPGMAHTHGARQGGPSLELIGQDLKAALCFADLKALFGIIDGHASGIIASILQAGQSLKHDGGSRFSSNESNDTTHGIASYMFICLPSRGRMVNPEVDDIIFRNHCITPAFASAIAGGNFIFFPAGLTDGSPPAPPE